MLWSLSSAALAALAVVVSTAAVVFLQREEMAQHQERIAELQTEADEARAAIAGANERAKVAEQRAAEADLARVQLEQKLAARQLSLMQRNQLVDRLKQFPGMVAHFWINPAGTTDTYGFGDLLYNLVQAAGWGAAKWVFTSGIPSPVGGVTITWRGGSVANKEAAETFAETLRADGIYVVAAGAFSKDDTTIGPQGQPAIPFVSGRQIKPPTIRIFVDTKPQ